MIGRLDDWHVAYTAMGWPWMTPMKWGGRLCIQQTAKLDGNGEGMAKNGLVASHKISQNGDFEIEWNWYLTLQSLHWHYATIRLSGVKFEP